jgi:hypothetical protein
MDEDLPRSSISELTGGKKELFVTVLASRVLGENWGYRERISERVTTS